MNAVKDFERAGTRGFFRPVGEMTYEEALGKVVEAVRMARELGLSDMVVNTTGLTGFGSLDVFARYTLGKKLVESAGAVLRLAMVVRPELIDPQKIGLIVYQNRGGSGEIFTSEVEALAWLDASLGTGLRTQPAPDRTHADK